MDHDTPSSHAATSASPAAAEAGANRATTRKKRRPWCQFSLRTLVVFVTIVSVLLGLFLARLQRARRQAEAIALIRHNGGSVDYDYMWRRLPNGELSRVWESPESFVPEWLLRWLGEDFFHEVLMADVHFSYADSQEERDNVVKAVGELHRLEELELYLYTGFDPGPSLEPLRQLANMRELKLSVAAFESHEFEVLESMPQLQKLTLYHQQIDEEAASHLASLTQLSALTIGWSETNDAAVKRLATLPRLYSLRFHDVEITDNALLAIARTKTLHCLSLNGTKITDRGVSYLCDLNHLRYIDLGETNVTGAEVRWPASLTRVDFWRSKFSDEGLTSMSRCRNVTHLDLSETQVSDVGVQWLVSLENLEWLELDRTSVSDASLELIGKLSALKHLSLNGTNVTDRGLEHLEGLPRLERLELGATNVTCESFRWPGTITVVELSQTCVTDDALMRLANCPKLTCVGAKHIQVFSERWTRFTTARPDVLIDEPLPYAWIRESP